MRAAMLTAWTAVPPATERDEVLDLVNLTGGVRYDEEPIADRPTPLLCDECPILGLEILLERDNGGLAIALRSPLDSVRVRPYPPYPGDFPPKGWWEGTPPPPHPSHRAHARGGCNGTGRP